MVTPSESHPTSKPSKATPEARAKAVAAARAKADAPAKAAAAKAVAKPVKIAPDPVPAALDLPAKAEPKPEPEPEPKPVVAKAPAAKVVAAPVLAEPVIEDVAAAAAPEPKKAPASHRAKQPYGPPKGELAAALVETDSEAKTSRAGRNLPAAIGVGVGLGALVLSTLYGQRDYFMAILVVAIALGIREIARAFRSAGFHVGQIPIIAGGGATVVLAYQRGPEAAIVGWLLTIVVVVLWRLTEPGRGLLKDLSASIFTVIYVPFLAAFAALLTAPADGPRRMTIFIATTVLSDIGGYAAGVFAGKHPMAPTVSPKKSWEGFGGSLLATGIGGGLMVTLLLHGELWQGVAFGFAVAVTATLGDLGESMLKRDMGIKDMGTLLPGHGGIMDRLDSLLMVAPVAWLLLSAFVPTY